MKNRIEIDPKKSKVRFAFFLLFFIPRIFNNTDRPKCGALHLRRKRNDMKFLRRIRNDLCYCGIEKKEYDAIKKDAYTSNFEVWRLLHCVMSAAFAFLFVYSLFVDLFKSNSLFYLIALIYSIAATVAFFVLKKDSRIAQVVIYVSITMLFMFGCLITQNKPDSTATFFVILLLLTPMLMINKPYYMAIEMAVVSVVFLVWMHQVKPFAIWQMDLINVIIYSIVGFVLHIIANSIRIKEFVLTNKINLQKDTDEMTGLKNKSSLTREINNYLSDGSKNKGIMLMLDINNFKSVNDNYGHDVGDSVITQFGAFLSETFINDEIIGRFGGDEFIVFIKDTDDVEYAGNVAKRIIKNTPTHIELPNKEQPITVSIGIAIYRGAEKNYSELFKKADIALYKTKADRSTGFNIC